MTIALTIPGAAEREVSAAKRRASVAVLIVDDNASKRLALGAVLAPLGHTIIEADSGVAALRCVMAQDFAVILLDVRMPNMDGFETASLIRLRWQSEMTPIIFITAHGSSELLKGDRYAEGAVDFMVAPVAPEELRAKVSVFANLYLKAEVLATRAREVQATADSLRWLTDAAPIGIFQTDPANRYVYTNPRWSEITGVSAADAFGREWDTILDPAQRPRLRTVSEELCERFEIATTDGEAPRIVLVTAKVTREGKRVAGWVGTLADVTAEVGAEVAMGAARDAATSASRLKSDFLANMSHEIRTPMNGVIGMTDLLLETDLDARQRDYAQTVRNSGEALLTIINDILDFSKVEAGKLEIEHTALDVRAVVDGVVGLLARSAQAKGLELIAVVGQGVPAVGGGDVGRVRQVLTNLIGNAIKFTQTGEVVIAVTSDSTADDGTVIRVEVIDTGVGIAADKLELVFEPFVQADTSTSRRYGGTGLGLAITSQLVGLMGGECGATSRVGFGSTFWFTFRLAASTGRGVPAPLSIDPDLAGVSVLVVDDSAMQREAISSHLAGFGMDVRAAETGEAALATLHTARIHGRPFDIAIVDRALPGMSGIELVGAIVAHPTLDVRVVLMTGLGEERELGGPGSGADATVSKPIRAAALRAGVRVGLGLQPADEIEIDDDARVPPSPTAPGGIRLLLAEDNVVNQKVAVAILSGAGYHVDTVGNGAQAVDAVAGGSYAAVLMDCQMPELNGYEATAAIRSLEGSARHTPIVALTAGARAEDRALCLAAGMDAYLAKPLDKDSLLGAVARATHPAGPPTGNDAASPLDLEVVGRLQRLGAASGEDLVGQLSTLFLADAASCPGALLAAHDHGDREELGRAAHLLSGASANLGASELAARCDAVARASTADDSGLHEAIDAVEAELERVRSALSAMAVSA